MPRNRPRTLRVAPRRHARAWEGVPPGRIGRLSTRTSLAIHRVERDSADYYVYTGATALALSRYRAFVLSPGRRPLYPQDAECSCRGCSLDDVRHARDVLDGVLQQLPARARVEL